MFFKKSTKVVQHGNNPTIRSPTVLLTTQATTDHLHVPHRTEYLPRNEHLSVFGASKPVLRTLWLQSNRISPRWKRSEFSVPLRVPREALIDGFEKILKSSPSHCSGRRASCSNSSSDRPTPDFRPS